MRAHQGISLLQGWFPLTLEIVTVVVLIVVIGWRTKRWRLIWLPISVAVGIAGALAARTYMNSQGLADDPAPQPLWIWTAVFVGAIAVAVVGWRGTRWWRRALSVLVLPLCFVCVTLVLNQWVGYFPTLSAVWGAITAGPLPDEVDASDLAGLRGTAPTTGKVVEVDIPDNGSDFKHRSEYVYLPPAWFEGDTPPKLPVLMMIGGEFNTAADWMRSGDAISVVDSYAAAHAGRTPILVFVDSSGSFNTDTECVDGPRGNAADHLTKDVRPYIVSQFGASNDAVNWGIVGWSMGGTCAVDLTTMHPDQFTAFEDIAGDIGPAAGTKDQTIARLFGGDAAKWASYDPMTVMATHGPYVGIAGWFEDTGQQPNAQKSARPGGHGNYHPPVASAPNGFGGHDDSMMVVQKDATEKLCAAASAQSIDCSVHTVVSGHTWQFATQAFADALPWIAGRIGA